MFSFASFMTFIKSQTSKEILALVCMCLQRLGQKELAEVEKAIAALKVVEAEIDEINTEAERLTDIAANMLRRNRPTQGSVTVDTTTIPGK